MRLEQTIVDKNFQEIKKHGTEQFPFAMYEDDFSAFEYGLILWHWHEEIQFTLVIEGEVHMLIGEKEVILNEGDGIFINSRVLHQIQPQLKNQGKVLSFIWKSSLVEQDILSEVYTTCILPILEGDDYRILSDREKEILIELRKLIYEKHHGYTLKIKGMLCDILYSLLTREGKEKSITIEFNSRDIMRAKQCMAYIHENYAKKISLGDIAMAAHISKSELCRCFKKVLHQTPFEYLIRYRVLKACQLIKNKDCSVTEAASMTGFDSISHMGRFFHKYMKQSPTQFRKS